MKIQAKLLLSFSLVAAICAIVGLAGWYGINSTRSTVKVLCDVNLPELQGLGLVMKNMNAVKSAERSMINPKLSSKDRERLKGEFESRYAELEEGWKMYTSAEKQKDEAALMAQAKEEMGVWKSEHLKMVGLLDNLRNDGQSDNANALIFEQGAAIAFGSQRAAFNALDKTLTQLLKMSRQKAATARDLANKTAGRDISVALLAMLLGVVAALALGYFIARQISDSIRHAILTLEKIGLGDTTTAATLSMGKAVNCSSIKNCGKRECPSFGRENHCWVVSGSMAVIKHCPRAKKGEDCRTCNIYGAKTETEELGSIINSLANSQRERENLAMTIADGDLTREVEIASAKDGLGKALQHMQERLIEIISQSKMAGEEIANGALQIADSSQNLAQGASEQASSLEEISSAMTQMSSQTRMTADSAHQAQELSNTAREAAEQGNRQMQQMISAMEEIRASSQSVANVIKVIEEIAFQTNMLALNAAVEAAHAGQHGKGFAVVAEEVRNLAARSAKAAKETTDLIAGSVAKTENGARIADQTAAALAEITNRVSHSAELVKSIAMAAQEQSQGISQVSQGLHQIDQVTQQNSANAEEGAAASEELSGQAAHLHQLMQRFKMAVEAGGITRQRLLA